MLKRQAIFSLTSISNVQIICFRTIVFSVTCINAGCYYSSDLTTLKATIVNRVYESWNRKVHCSPKLQILYKSYNMIDKIPEELLVPI